MICSSFGLGFLSWQKILPDITEKIRANVIEIKCFMFLGVGYQVSDLLLPTANYFFNFLLPKIRHGDINRNDGIL